MTVESGTILRLMLVGTGTTVALAAKGGSPAVVYTTTAGLENVDVVGPCELTIAGTNTFWTSSRLN